MPIPEVSVIITSHNRADYLHEAVDSILNQALKPYEIVIVDDGSTDQAPQVAREYADKYDHVSFIAQENAGVAVARNTGVQNSSGEFIAFQDDDDISHPDRLSKQVAILRAHPDIAACVSNFARVGKTTAIARKKKSQWLWQGHGHMFRRNVYLALGGQRAYLRTSEDADFFLRFDEKYQYHFIDEVLYYHRKYASGASNNLTNSPPLEILSDAAAVFVNAHYRRNGLAEPITQKTNPVALLPQIKELPADMRLRLLHVTRNMGRRLLAQGEASSDNMQQIRRYIELLGHGECQKQTKKYCRWLTLQSLRHGHWKNARLFLSTSIKPAS